MGEKELFIEISPEKEREDQISRNHRRLEQLSNQRNQHGLPVKKNVYDPKSGQYGVLQEQVNINKFKEKQQEESRVVTESMGDMLKRKAEKAERKRQRREERRQKEEEKRNKNRGLEQVNEVQQEN